MAGDVITIAGGKGGVGKTTTSLNTGIAIQEADYETIIVDADLGMTNLAEMLGMRVRQTIHDVLAGEAAINDAIYEGPGGVSILPGDESLDAFARGDPSNLQQIIHSLEDKYDNVIIDTGSGITRETMIPIRMADRVILVTTSDEVALVDTEKTAELGDRFDSDVLGVVITRATPEMDISTVSDSISEQVLTVVPENHEAAMNEPMLLNFPDSYAARAYRRLAKRLLDRTRPAAEILNGN